MLKIKLKNQVILLTILSLVFFGIFCFLKKEVSVWGAENQRLNLNKNIKVEQLQDETGYNFNQQMELEGVHISGNDLHFLLVECKGQKIIQYICTINKNKLS